MSSQTAVLLVDPLNDFLHPDGKLHAAVQESLETKRCVNNMQRLVKHARAAGISIFYALHQQVSETTTAEWQHMNPSLLAVRKARAFEEGSWGAQIFSGLEPQSSKGDVVVSKHWNSSSFANTDLDYHLRQRDITRLVLSGMTANTCLESTARCARELGYHVTLLADATAGFSNALTDAATDLIWPLIAEKVTTVDSWAAGIGSSSEAKM